jgi:hypothetical protein
MNACANALPKEAMIGKSLMLVLSGSIFQLVF